MHCKQKSHLINKPREIHAFVTPVTVLVNSIAYC